MLLSPFISDSFMKEHASENLAFIREVLEEGDERTKHYVANYMRNQKFDDLLELKQCKLLVQELERCVLLCYLAPESLYTKSSFKCKCHYLIIISYSYEVPTPPIANNNL